MNQNANPERSGTKNMLEELKELKNKMYRTLDEIMDIVEAKDWGEYGSELETSLKEVEESVKKVHLCINDVMKKLQD